jgi:hypothetical protein
MKALSRLLFASLLLAALFTAGCASPPVARVSGVPVTREEFTKALEQGIGLNEEFRAGRVVLDTLIGIQLIEKEAKQQGVEASDAELNAALEQYKKGLQASTNLPFDEFLKKSGVSLEDIKSRLKVSVLLRKLVVSDQEIEEYYKAHAQELNKPERVSFLQVLLPDEKAANAFRAQFVEKKQDLITSAQAWQKAGNQIFPPAEGVKRTLAVDKLEELGKPLKAALLSLQPGAISKPLVYEATTSPDAQAKGIKKIKVWTLVLLESHDPAEATTLEKSRELIREQLFGMKSYTGEVARYLNSLKSRARIEILDPKYQSLTDDYKKLAEAAPKPQLPTDDHGPTDKAGPGAAPSPGPAPEAAPHSH